MTIQRDLEQFHRDHDAPPRWWVLNDTEMVLYISRKPFLGMWRYHWRLVTADHVTEESKVAESGTSWSLRKALEKAYRTWLILSEVVALDAWDIPMYLPESKVESIYAAVEGGME